MEKEKLENDLSEFDLWITFNELDEILMEYGHT